MTILSIAAHAYQGRPAPDGQGSGTLEERRAQLFAVYTEAVFNRRGKSVSYTPEQCLHWLGWLATTLLRQHQSVFYMEWMQPDWLPKPAQRWVTGVGSVIVSALLVGVVVGLFGHLSSGFMLSLPIALVFGLSGGLVVGLFGYGDHIQPITRLHWAWSNLWEGLSGKLVAALGIGLFLGAVTALIWDWVIGVAVGAAMPLSFCYWS